MVISGFKRWVFRNSPPRFFSLITNKLWKIHPEREKVNSNFVGNGWIVKHEDHELFVPHRRILQSLSVKRPYQRYISLEEGEKVLDVGATVGEDTVHMIKEVGETGQVYSIEAEPNNVDILVNNLKKNSISNVNVYPYAVWNEKSTISFYRDKRPTDGSIFESHLPRRDKEGDRIEVDSYPIDKIVGDTRIDFMKMNIEGAELKALEGANHVLRGLKKCFITTDHLVDGEFTTGRVMDILGSYGFDIRWVEPQRFRYVVGRKK